KGGVDAVGALVRLAGDWLALSDDVSRCLADDAGLVPSLTHEATESARAFGHATAAHKKNGGSMRKGDPPEVNVIEGRVVFEMRALLAALKEARRTNPKVEVPRIESSLKSVLGGDAAAQRRRRAEKRASPLRLG